MANSVLDELVNKQLRNIDASKKLKYNDLKRISKYVNTTLFDPNKCCLWSGYITNADHTNKGTYVNFYFEGKKIALHRLLYMNFVCDLNDNDYLKFSCENKGKCCNIYHLHKFQYVPKKNTKPTKIAEKEPQQTVPELEPDEYIVNFD